jgi:GDP-D-mannose dehydratase
MTEDRKVALVTGITGQDGSYLAEFLLEKGYEVSDDDDGYWREVSSPECVLYWLCSPLREDH